MRRLSIHWCKPQNGPGRMRGPGHTVIAWEFARGGALPSFSLRQHLAVAGCAQGKGKPAKFACVDVRGLPVAFFERRVVKSQDVMVMRQNRVSGVFKANQLVDGRVHLSPPQSASATGSLPSTRKVKSGAQTLCT